MKIYTKTGDEGTTGLFAGPRVFKDDPRICAYGSVDELNASLGVVQSCLPSELAGGKVCTHSLSQIISEVQSDLFCIGAELATPDPDATGMRLLGVQRTEQLESWIDAVELELSPLNAFILPGGCPSSALLHLARTVCRRAEREVVGLCRQIEAANYDQVVVYLNRLGDFLFVLARLSNLRSGQSESQWHK